MSLDPTPMGSPVPAGECPHCGAFLWIQLRAKPPVALAAGPGQPPPSPPSCCACPHCGGEIWFAIGRLAPLASPAKPAATALVPKGATTRRMP